MYSVSKKIPLLFSDVFPKRLGIFSPNFTRLLYVPIDAEIHIFIQLSATSMKLYHIKRDHHYMLKTSTIVVVAHSRLIRHNFVKVEHN